MKRLLSPIIIMMAAHMLGACTFDSALNELNKTRPPLPVIEKILLFEPNVQIFSLQIGGHVVKEDEIATIMTKLRSEIGRKLQERGFGVAVFAARDEKMARAVEQLAKLNFAVSRTKEAHAFPAGLGEEWFQLPTVNQTTEYELPAPTKVIAPDISDRYGTNFGLITSVYDEQRTGGRLAGEFLVALLAGAQAVRPGFLIVNFSLIALDEGKELWAHTEFSTTNDITTESTLTNTIDSALKNFKTGQQLRVGATRQ